VLKDQHYKCAIYKRSAGVWDYDHHIDGNRSNNDIFNCQALCPNCHAKKTRGLLEQEKSSRRGIIIAIVIIMIFLAMVAIIFN
jgi:5-methylcytosine-specific restriction endonuclease McrA